MLINIRRHSTAKYSPSIRPQRHEQTDDNQSTSGPHLVLYYKDKSILEDASNLLIHHVKRQTSIQKQEKTKIKYILRQFLPDMFFSSRQQLSDDERDDGEFEPSENTFHLYPLLIIQIARMHSQRPTPAHRKTRAANSAERNQRVRPPHRRRRLPTPAPATKLSRRATVGHSKWPSTRRWREMP